MPCGNNLGYKSMIHRVSGMQVMKRRDRMGNTNRVRTIPAFHTGNIPVSRGTSLHYCPGRQGEKTSTH